MGAREHRLRLAGQEVSRKAWARQGGGVARSAVAWSVLKGVRLDGFADTAVVRDPGFGRGLRNYTGFGAALESPAPFGMLLAVEWGYGVRGVNTDGRLGTHVVRISGYKVF